MLQNILKQGTVGWQWANQKQASKGRDTPSQQSASDGQATLFGVSRRAHIDSSLPDSTCWIGVRAVGQRENSDWMISLSNESVPENYSKSDENKHVNEGGTDRRLFKCYVIFPNHSIMQMFS